MFEPVEKQVKSKRKQKALNKMIPLYIFIYLSSLNL